VAIVFDKFKGNIYAIDVENIAAGREAKTKSVDVREARERSGNYR